MIGKCPCHQAFTSAPWDTRSSIIGMRYPLSAARISGPSPPWCTSDPLLDHPFRHGQSRRTRRFPRHAAFGNPRERPILAVTKRSTVQRRVARHQALDAIDVVGVDRLLELPDLLQGLDVSLELRPTRKPIETRDLELRIGDRFGRAGLQQILGLVLQMAQIGTVGKRAWGPWGRSTWRPPFIKSPVVRTSG